MALFETPLSQEVQDAQALNKPFFLADHLDTGSATFEWITAELAVGSWTLSADITDSAFPASRLADRFNHLESRPTAAPTINLDSKWIVIQVEPGGLFSFDSIVIGKNNFFSTDKVTEVKIYASDLTGTAAFEAAVGTTPPFDGPGLLAKQTVTAGPNDFNMAFPTLDLVGLTVPNTIINAASIWIALRGKALDDTYTPGVGEVFIGPRRALLHNSDKPYNDLGEQSDVDQFTSRSGVKQRFVNNRGQAIRRFTMQTGTDNEIEAIRDWWDDTAEGTKPFYFVEDPGKATFSERRPYLMVMSQRPSLDLPIQGPIRRTFRVDMEEQAPFLSAEKQRKP